MGCQALVSPGQHLGGTGDGDLCAVVVGGRVVNRGQAQLLVPDLAGPVGRNRSVRPGRVSQVW